MDILLCSAMGYLLGTFNPAYIFGRLRGFDIRRHGSGNAGATNVVLIMGKAAGAVCAALDIFKSFFAYKIAKLLFPALTYAGILAGCACILGHIFPAWMGFSGGKGLASMAGLVLAYNAKLFLFLLVIEVILTLLVNYICFMPLSLCVIFPIIYALQTSEWIGTLLLASLIPVVVYKHLPNLRRIFAGQEARVSWLWNSRQEEARLKENFSEQEWKARYRKVH